MSTQEHKSIYESPDKGKTVYRRKFGDYNSPRELVNKSFSWPLMKDCITAEDKKSMVDFIQKSERLTNGPMVKKFEQEWSKWLGCKYSLFVSSGSTANLLLVAAIKEKYKLKEGDKVIVPAITWVTNISPVIQLGLQPIFCDIDPKTFSFDLNNLKQIAKDHPDIKMAFVTHLFGIPADIDSYKEIFPNALFIEDVCESHGATYKNNKCGTLSEGSTFSSYFGHHMTTVEGGFVCTNDTELYNLMKIKRSHGMAREALPEKFEEYKAKYPDIHPQFMFVTDGYNLRSMEINAVLGLSQLKRLDDNNKKRKENFIRFIDLVSKHPQHFITDYQIEGNSSFCLPFICKSKSFKTKLETHLNQYKVETRPLCSGNLLRQPFLQREPNIPSPSLYPTAEFLHENGFFIGNNHMITKGEWDILEKIINDYVK
mgnify:CR=1 FL=1|tara:strand:- start:2042 stop:3322 length:1281 start_codon:yes stop_codon:yes gene_type:complete